MDFETIKTQTENRVTTIRLNRPQKHNALNQLMIAELSQAFDFLNTDDDTRVILIKGNGESFCSGADLNYMKDIASFEIAQNQLDATKLAELFKKIYFCSKPVIASTHGSVFGGANGIAAASDIVLADEQTIFAFTEVKLGITPATISPYVIRRCGEAATRELMLTGRKISAQEAEKFHLVNSVTTYETSANIEEFYINHFLAAAPNAIAECKKLIRTVTNNSFDEAYYYTIYAIAEQRCSKEGIEGMTAFFEKRKPYWM